MPSVLFSEVGGAAWLLDENEWASSVDVAAASEVLADQGLAAMPAAISAETAAAVRDEVLAARERILSLPLHESAPLLGEIRQPLYRHDIKLELVPAICELLLELRASRVAQLIAASVGEDAALCELSCIISERGAAPQPAHADTPAREEDAKTTHHRALARHGSRLFTVFVALGDISPSMGPTLMWPRTHTREFQDVLRAGGSSVLSEALGVHMDLSSGDAVVMDSRLWHRGGANMDETGRQRCLLVISFCSPAFFPEGDTYSLLPHIAGRFSLLNMSALLCALKEGAYPALAAMPYADRPRTDVADGEGSADHHTAPVELARASAAQLMQLVQTLPVSEPRAAKCVRAIEMAVGRQASEPTEDQLLPTVEGAVHGALTHTSTQDGACGRQASVQSGASALPTPLVGKPLDCCLLPVAALRTLSTYGVLGPHLHASPRWAALQSAVEEALKAREELVAERGLSGVPVATRAVVGREELRRRWLVAHGWIGKAESPPVDIS